MVDINKNPRSWSGRFWKKNNISEVLKEVVQPDEVDVTSIQMHETLNPLIWDENENIKPDVRKALLLNAKRFIEYSDMENLNFNDVLLIGSMANYNYSENSDLDIHIILDFKQISDNEEFVGDYLKLKKTLWNERLPIQVKGHDVEMYYENNEVTRYSSGAYSLIKNLWIRKPTKKIINVDTGDVQLKASDLMNAIDDLESNLDSEDFTKKYNDLRDKIKKYRQSGLEKGGEFSTENLVFKVIRNTGYLEKLYELNNQYLTQELSLDEFLNPEL
jgi:predicted nucleotidyltransferase